MCVVVSRVIVMSPYVTYRAMYITMQIRADLSLAVCVCHRQCRRLSSSHFCTAREQQRQQQQQRVPEIKQTTGKSHAGQVLKCRAAHSERCSRCIWGD